MKSGCVKSQAAQEALQNPGKECPPPFVEQSTRSSGKRVPLLHIRSHFSFKEET